MYGHSLLFRLAMTRNGDLQRRRGGKGINPAIFLTGLAIVAAGVSIYLA